MCFFCGLFLPQCFDIEIPQKKKIVMKNDLGSQNGLNGKLVYLFFCFAHLFNYSAPLHI